MTTPTGQAAETPAADGAARAETRPRPTRRSPTELVLRFPDRDLAEALVAERDEPDWLRAERLAAAEAYARLPLEPNPLYTTYLDFRNVDLAAVRPYVATAEAPAPDADPTIPAGAAGIVELVEDRVARLALTPAARERGVVLETLGGAVRRDPQGVRADLEGAPRLPADERLAQLVRGFWNQGVRLVVPDGVELAEPVVVRWASGRPGRALIGRTVVRLGAGASASIVEELVDSGLGDPGATDQALVATTTEAALGRDARLTVASIQDCSARQVVVQHRWGSLGPGSSLVWALAQLGSLLVRSRVDTRLEGDGSEARLAEIVFGTDDQVFDLTTYTRHIGRDTTGDILSRAVLADSARTFLKGLSTIERSAIGTDSFLGEYGMNLSKRARAVAIPSLEIDQPDCRRAAHSSAVGPIDEAQVFYLMSRGIPPDEARKIIVLGFLEPVVARVPLPEIEERLRALLDAKWASQGRTTAAA